MKRVYGVLEGCDQEVYEWVVESVDEIKDELNLGYEVGAIDAIIVFDLEDTEDIPA